MGGRGRRGTKPRGAASPGAEPRSCSLEEERLRVECLCATEDAAHAAGFRVVAGVDEVGRGCLAGPVYAGAVVLSRRARPNGLDDSKVLLEEVREAVSRKVHATSVGVGIGAATPAEIDALGIVEASFLAMRRALGALERSGVVPDLVLVDAFRSPGVSVSQKAFVHGDARVGAIAAASVVAKSARDHVMDDLAGDYPHYGFDAHRGYATPEHLDALHRHGPSPVHRLSFERVVPVRGPAALSRGPLLRETVFTADGVA